jgi:hypothetical protein
MDERAWWMEEEDRQWELPREKKDVNEKTFGGSIK